MKIAVAGGTGVVGSYVVEHVRASGHEPVLLTRSVGVDLMTGAALEETLAGVEAVIDVLSVETQSAARATGFFETTSRHLLAAGQGVGVRHHVALSIVGIDEVPMGYYRAKVAQERVVGEGRVPWTVLRATQFHEFAGQVLRRMGAGPVALVPAMLCQPVAADEVAARLVDLALGEPMGRAPDLGVPERRSLVAMARAVVGATGQRRLVVPLRIPGVAGRAIREGALCPYDGTRGAVGFEDWLRGH